MIRQFFDFLAKMGLSVRDDPPKSIELTGREWGPEKNGLVFSSQAGPGVISVILRNIGTETQTYNNRFDLLVDGAEPTPFGKAVAAKPASEAQLPPGAAVEVQIPIESLYRLRPGAQYRVTASCGPLVSNTVLFTATAG